MIDIPQAVPSVYSYMFYSTSYSKIRVIILILQMGITLVIKNVMITCQYKGDNGLYNIVDDYYIRGCI